LKRLSTGTNVTVLDDDELVIDGVRFLGATLWTDFDLYGDLERSAAIDEANRWIRDFSRIRRDEESASASRPTNRRASSVVIRSGWPSGWPRRTPGRPWSSPITRRRLRASTRAFPDRC
jgi:hypothetical protein